MNIRAARKKTARIRKERTLLLLYAIAVTGAFLVYVYNNNMVEASIPDDVKLSEELQDELVDFEDYTLHNLKESVEEEVYEDVSITPMPKNELSVIDDENNEELEVVEEEKNPEIQENVVVQKGDSFISVLTKKGLTYAQASQIYTKLKKVYDARTIKVGQEITLTMLPTGNEDSPFSITRIVIEPTSGTRYIVEKNVEDSYEPRVEQDEFTTEIKTASGIIDGSVSMAMTTAGVPSKVVGNFINIFSFSVDFRRDVRVGDKFEVKYEQYLDSKGEVVRSGEIIFAALQLRKDKIELYRFKNKAGHTDYYTEKGLALKKNLDRKPMEFKRARISSNFGRRFHPILKVYRNHHGVDYAAPSGSKVYASGDGVITMAKRYGSYGNFISIRHNSEYSTGYGHLKSFAKGIRPGVRVKQGQLIAYVGSTGRSTGPHLHFEVVRNGVKVNPLKVKAATGENLSGENLKKFKQVVAEVKALGLKETASNETDTIQEFAKNEIEDVTLSVESTSNKATNNETNLKPQISTNKVN